MHFNFCKSCVNRHTTLNSIEFIEFNVQEDIPKSFVFKPICFNVFFCNLLSLFHLFTKVTVSLVNVKEEVYMKINIQSKSKQHIDQGGSL